MPKGKKPLPDSIQAIQDEKVKIIGNRISDLSYENSITIEKLAEKIGISGDQVKKYRNGKSAPAIGTLFYLSSKDVFNCDVDYLLGILPDGQKTYRSHDLNSLTGIDNHASDKLLAHKDQEEEHHTLGWFINNGLLNVLQTIQQLDSSLSSIRNCYTSLPDDLKGIISKIIDINNDKVKEYSNLALWVHSQDYNHIKELSNAFQKCDFTTANLSSPYTYDFLLIENSKSSIKEDKEHIPTDDEFDEASMVKEHEESLLFDHIDMFIDIKKSLDRITRTELFWISEKFNDLVLEYLKDSKEGDEK